MGDDIKNSMTTGKVMYGKMEIHIRDKSISGLNKIEQFLDDIKNKNLLPLISTICNDTSNQIFSIYLIKGLKLEGIIYKEIDKISSIYFECQYSIHEFEEIF